MAQKAGIMHPFSHTLKMAGKGWLSGFMSRYPNLSIREPQGTNLSRAVGFNKPKVQQFLIVYREVLESHPVTAATVEYG